MIQDYESNITYHITNKKKRHFFVIRYCLPSTDTWVEINRKEFHYKCSSQLETKRFIEQNALGYINDDMGKRNLISSNNLTLSKAIDFYLDEKEFGIGVRASTKESNKAILNKYLCNTYKKLRIDQSELSNTITPQTILYIKQAINHGSYLKEDGSHKEISQSRKQRIYNEIISFFTYCRKSKFITPDQADDLINSLPSKIIVHENKEVGSNYLTIDEMQVFLNTFNNEDEAWRMFFYLMFKLGLRIGENMGLRFSDIDFENKQISIHGQIDKHGEHLDHTKTAKSSAPVNIEQEDIDKLLVYQKEIFAGPEEYIFFGTTHTCYSTAKRILNKHLKMANLKKITLHGFRHSICVFLCSQGIMTLPEISKFMRHDSIEVTVKYYAKWIKIDEHIKDNYSKSFSAINIK